MSGMRGKLDPALVKSADDRFYTAHPEMVRDGNRVPIGIAGKEEDLASEWQGYYKAARAEKVKSTPTLTTAAGSEKTTCPHVECVIREVEVRCGHDPKGKRTFRLKLPDRGVAEVEHRPPNVIEVLDEEEGDEIEMAIRMAKPHCKMHAHEPADVRPEAEGFSATTSMAKFRARASDAPPLNTWPTEWLRLMSRACTVPVEYALTPEACENGTPCMVVVRSYPKWSVDLTATLNLCELLGFRHNQSRAFRRGHGANEQMAGPAKVQASGVSGGITFKGDTWKYDRADFNKLAQRWHVIGVTRDLVTKYLAPMLTRAKGKITLEFLTASIVYKMALEERSDRFDVGVTEHVKIGFSPLFKASGNIDVLEWLISACPAGALYTVLTTLRGSEENDESEEPTSGRFGASGGGEITLTPAGQIDATCEWEKKVSDAQRKVTGEVSGKITLKLEAQVHAKGKALILKFEASAGFEAMTGFGIKAQRIDSHDATPVQWKVIGFHEGLKIFYWAYCEGRISRKPMDSSDGHESENKAGHEVEPIRPGEHEFGAAPILPFE